MPGLTTPLVTTNTLAGSSGFISWRACTSSMNSVSDLIVVPSICSAIVFSECAWYNIAAAAAHRVDPHTTGKRMNVWQKNSNARLVVMMSGMMEQESQVS
eukprot:CAMPEP_0113665852 /NCGR_PEP_ID=MMETSP0038_2-20120614/2533_1 /TAXON_ID=2898 /ORGANISM="Cryptomonas paramecium" /LENGTH=99 /DNA_ID=CAMNT_0000581247 /DNA_START=287 /DNA_END=582 /DNA_ORIENTATION=- /assembly_acc=CAM_ASM_000170